MRRLTAGAPARSSNNIRDTPCDLWRTRVMKRFVKCFVIAGGISSPAWGQTPIYGVNLSLQSSGASSGTGWTLSSNGYEGTYIQVPTSGATVSFDLNAAGFASNSVLPDVTLSVAGTNVPFTVTTASNGDYLANIALPGDSNPTNSNGNGTYLVRLQLDNQSASATPSVKINSLKVTGATVISGNTDALALDAAQTYADKFRSGPGTITLDNANGVHFGAGTSVQVKLISNAFNFAAAVYGNNTTDANWINVGPNGQNLAPTTTEQIKYQQALLNPANGFNMIVPSNAGKWQNNQFNQNDVTMNLVYAMDQFAAQNNLAMRMHNLIWNSQQPSWVNSLFSASGTLTTANEATLNAAITSRIGYYVSADDPNTGKPLADSYQEMDVLNEAWHGQSAQDNYIGAGALGVSGVAAVYAQVAAAVSAAGANTRLYTNEYNVLQFSPQSISSAGMASGMDPYANWYLNDVQGLQNAGGPVSGIGMELYVNTSNVVSPAQMQDAMGNLSVAKNPSGNPIDLTLSEFGVANGQAPTATTYDTDLTDALTMAYGNPQVTTFGYWAGVGGPEAGTNSIYALYNQNYAITSAGTTWQTWMSQYQTNDTLTTTANGQVSFNGTYGEYDVIVNGQTYLLDLVPGTTSYGLMTPLTAATWSGSGTDNNWSTGGNWTSGALPANAPVIFAGTTGLANNNNSAANTEYAGITFNAGAGAFVVGGNAINLAGDIVNNSANLQTINLNLAMQQNTNLNAASGDLAVGGAISGAFSVTKLGAHTLTLSGANTYAGPTTVSAGALIFAANGALPANSSLAINGTSLVQMASNTGLATVSSLAIAGGATLDITNNHLIINYGATDPASTISAYLATGYAGGNWNGPGIDSSAAAANPGYALGYADGADGVVTGLNSGQIEVMYTLYGDANLDGVVNGSDFGILAANFGTQVNGWDRGDFNYDDVVNGSDFGLLASNFGMQANGADAQLPADDLAALDAFAAANGLLADVPEPASIGLVTFGVIGVLIRRRRSKSA
jgi:autotransporter-associated beta strand protein